MTGDVATVDTLTALSRLIGRVVSGRKRKTQPKENSDMRKYTLTYRAMHDDRLTVVLDVDASRATEAIRWGREELEQRFGADNAQPLYLSDYTRDGHRRNYRTLTSEQVGQDEAAAARAHRDSPEIRAAIAEAVQHRHEEPTMTAGISTPVRASSPDWGPASEPGPRPQGVAPAAWGIR